MIVSSVGLFAQTDYYWYKGQKVVLEKNPTKKYILFEESETASSISKSIGISEKAVVDKGTTSLPASIKLHSSTVNKPQKWVVVESNVTLASTSMNSKIVYEANFYKAKKDEEVGITHLFNVQLKSVNDVALLEQLAKANNVTVVGSIKSMPLWYVLSCTNKSHGSALQMANKFYETGYFKTSEPDMLVKSRSKCVNDNLWGDQWGFNNTGQENGTSGIDINFCQSRQITTGNEDIIIAVYDDGVEPDHPDLTNIAAFSYDIATDGTSVTHGFHGTACAGIIGANSNNTLGVSGIAPDCPIMRISSSRATFLQFAEGFIQAADNGASVISNSWTITSSAIIDDGIEYALTEGRNGLGCVVVFATGNNNGAVGYPANSNPDIIAVGAASPCGERKRSSSDPLEVNTGVTPDPNGVSCDDETWWGSNFGDELDIVAPGVLIPTTDRQGAIGYNTATGVAGNYDPTFNGTSSATPHVAAVAGLVLSINPELTQQQVSTIIEQSAQKTGGYNYATTVDRPNGTWHNEMGYGFLDANAAVLLAQQTLCNANITITEPISNTTRSFTASNSITANNSINTNATVTYGANNSVRLTTGFKVSPGSSFIANLNGCTQDATTLSALKSYNEQVELSSSLDISSIHDAEAVATVADVSLNSITLSPNPTSGYSTLSGLSRGASIKVFDKIGSEIISAIASENTFEINLSNQVSGVYIIQITDNNTITSKKIVLN